MNSKDRGVLYGLAIGDGGIYIIPSQAATTARLIIGHGPKQIDYLNYKADLLHSVLGGKRPSVYEYTSKNKTTNKTYVNHQLYKNDAYFRQMHRVLYPTGKKVYTEQLLSYLTDHSLALWYMDDGSAKRFTSKDGANYTGSNTRLSTYCSKEEAELLRDWFEHKYQITPKFDVDKRNGKFSLRFNTAESNIFTDIVYPYVVPSLSYKVEHVVKYSPRVQGTQTSNIVGEDIV